MWIKVAVSLYNFYFLQTLVCLIGCILVREAPFTTCKPTQSVQKVQILKTNKEWIKMSMTFNINHNLTIDKFNFYKRAIHMYLHAKRDKMFAQLMYIEKYFFGRKWLNITFELEFFVEPVQKKLDHSPKKNKPFKSHAIAK